MLQSLLAPKKTFHRATSNLLSYIGNKFNRLNAIVFNRNKIRYNKGNALLIGKSELKHCSILIIGKNNCVRIEDGCNLRGVRILVSGNGSKVTIGCNVIINASKYQPTIINAAGGTSVSIGDNSLLSNNIEIHSSDYHDVLNDEGHVINEPQNTFIGNHVWIGLGIMSKTQFEKLS
jgi:acetyltransferase-like isoleucine patch superfamily enzyme